MSIVFITIPGHQKRMFANDLHKQTNSSVAFVIVQKTRRVPFQERFQKLLKTVGWKNILKEFYFVIYIRFNKQFRSYLKYFFSFTKKELDQNYEPQYIEVDSVNSEQVYELLQNIKPRLIVVWGSNILEKRIFSSAPNAINLHMGLGEHYRGSVANHYAVLEDKRNTIGATIHKIDEKTDTGDIYKTIHADLSLAPKELFTKLNDQAFSDFLDISIKLWKGDNLKSKPQNLKAGKNILLRHWLPSRRFQVAKKINDWENKKKAKKRK